MGEKSGYHEYATSEAAKQAAIDDIAQVKKKREAEEKAARSSDRRTFLKQAGGGAAAVALAGILGREVLEQEQELSDKERELKEIDENTKNLQWVRMVVAARQVNEERDAKRRGGHTGRIGQTRVTTTGVREVATTPRVETEVEKMMKDSGSTLARENRLLAERCKESTLARKMLGLPENADNDSVMAAMETHFQSLLGSAAAVIYGPHGSQGKIPGERGSPERNEFMKYANRRFALFLKYRDKIETAVLKYSKIYDVPARRIYGLIGAEGSNTLSEKSSAQAFGLMQVMPDSARAAQAYAQRLGQTLDISDMSNIDANIHAGVVVYKGFLEQYGQHGLAAVAYNGGPVNINRAIDGLAQAMPEETINTKVRDRREWQRTGINLTTLRVANLGPAHVEAIGNNIGQAIGYAFSVELYGNMMHEVLNTKEE